MCLFLVSNLLAQVPVNINSGNPNFPFPQFLEYANGKTLAKYNAEGVTHADMEKTIREAWQIFANEFRYTGESQGGVQYIRGNLGCPYDCTEGAGYSMLGAAYMADKTTFDGLWMRTHDHFMVRDVRYQDGTVHCANYEWGRYTLAEACNQGSAGDGDWDIALSLLMAYNQWGASSGIIVQTSPTTTKVMNYLEEAKKVISSLVDTTKGYTTNGIFVGYNSGSIGHDGYPKGGNKQNEATTWNAGGNPLKYNSNVMCGDNNGVCPAGISFASYIAPAYYRSFSEFLASNGGTTWTIEQYRRAEASTDWIMGQVVAQNRLPYLGGFLPNNTGVTFYEVDPAQGKADGESFRMAWRTILNGLWRGNGIYNWNPTTHQYSAGSTTYMKQNADNIATLFKDPGICAALGSSPDPVANTVKYKGVSQIRQFHLSDGSSPSGNWTNYTLGSSAPAIALHGDEQLAAQIFRQLELKWDDKDVGLPASQTNPLISEPKYFHGWFRLLGMLTLSGNLHAPEDMVAKANMKVYMSVDKTFAFTGDQVTYKIDYRNYGKVAATSVVIQVPVDAQYKVISAVGGSLSGNMLTYTIPSVPGLESGLALTKGSYTFVVQVQSPKIVDKVCQTSTITCSNGFGWTSNEYPNNATYTMERNCVDILGTRSLKIEKLSDKTEVNPGNEVTFTLNFSNSSDAGWLNGGRQHVNFSYGYSGSGNTFFHLFRNWNNADEAYIDLSNYRVSYFMFDNVNKGIYNASTNPTGWALIGKDLQSGNIANFDFKGESIPTGDDAGKKWDQRLIIRFPPDITAPTHTVFSHLNNRYQLHKGTLLPIWYSVQMEATPSSPLFTGRIQDDWSYKSTAFSASVGSGAEPYFLIGPNYANPNSTTGLVMDRFDKDACTAFFTPDKIYDKLLVEEFDGYTWRRIAGEGPLPGREMYNVVVEDTLPVDLKFVSFIDNLADGVTATLITSGGREIVRWSVPKMLVGVIGDLKYKTIALGTCPMTDKLVTNRAWIWSSTDSKTYSAVDVNITCSFVPPPLAGTTMVKLSDKTTYAVNDNINYSIKFKQTLGSVSIPPLNDATRWTAINGTAKPNFTATAIDFDNGTPSIFVRENYSHGKNGTLITKVDHDGQETFGFVFRYTSGNRPVAGIQGIYVEMQLAYWGNQAIIRVWENGVLKASIPQTAYAAPFTEATLKFELIDGTMKIWINNITGLPFQTITGLNATNAGYAGFAVGDADNSSSIWSKPKILNWDARFDSAFDIIISDPLPAELTFVSASNPGTSTASKVSWPKVSGPVLYGDSIKYTFVAKLNSCPASGKIINVAYVNLFGFKTDSIGAQNISSCGSVTPCTVPTTPVISSNQSICTGTVPAQIGGAVLAGGSATGTASYAWETSINGTTGWTVVSGATLKDYTPVALTATRYYRRIDSKGGCSSLPSNVITITVTPAVVAGTISAAQTICTGTIPTALTGTVSTGGVTIKNYKWQSSLTGLAPWTQVAAYSTTGTGFAPAALTATTHYRRIDSSGVCAGVPTDTIVITVTPAVTAGTISAAQTICSGATPTAFTGTVSAGGVTVKNYKWQISPTGLAGSWLPAAAYSTIGTGFAPGTLTADTYYRRIDSSGVCAGVASNTIKITVTPTIVPSVAIATPSTTICTGASITLTATPTNGGTPTYQWYKGTAPSGVSLGATATNATYTTTTAANNDSYYVVMTSTATCASPATATSNAIVITVTTAVTPAVTITAAPGNTICSGASVTFTAVPGNGGLAPTYEWFVKKTTDATPQSQGAASSAVGADEFTSTGLTNGDEVSVLMTSNSGCVVAPGTATSNVITMVVNPNVTASVAIATPSTTICTGASITFTATPTNGGTPTYQWRKNGVNISAETNATYVTTGAANNDSYDVIMTSTANCVSPTTATSTPIVITVTTVVTPAVSITAAPGNTICAGASVTFTAVAGNGGSNPTYEWFVKKTTDATPQSQGAASSAVGADEFTSTALTNGDEISVVMTSNSGCVAAPGTATSNVITMTVNSILAPAVSITVNDVDQTICPNTSITFTATPTNGGTPPGYVWKKNGIAITPAETGSTYTTTTAVDGDIYTVDMTSTALCAPSTPSSSNPITITVTPVPSISVSIGSNVTSICENNAVAFTATASGSGSTPAPTYEWFVTSASTATGGISQGSPSTTATSFATSALTATNNKVYVEVVSNATCASTTAVASNVIAITVNTGIAAGTIGSDQTICYNTPAPAFTELTASGAVTPTYQWRASATSTGTYTDIPGATNISYTPPAVGLTQDVYLHRVVTDGSVTGTCNTATSNAVEIIVLPILVAGTVGADETICSGIAPATMNQVTAPTGGTGAYTYQWQSDASGAFANISGATNSSYTSPAITTTTRFQRVETSGTCGSVTSNIVTKTVTAPEVVTVSINDPGQICASSGAFNFIANAATSGTGTLSYAWSILDPLTNIATPIGTNSATDLYSPVSGDHTKLIQVVVTSSNGCNAGPATASVVLDIVDAITPTVTITGDPVNCAGLMNTFTMSATGGGTTPGPNYQWYLIPAATGTPQAVGTGGLTYSNSSLISGDKVYVEMTSSSTCLAAGLSNPFKSNEITMQIKPIPAPSIVEGNQTICSPNSFTFHGNVTAGNSYEWRQLPSNTVVGTGVDLTIAQSGTYTLYEDNGTCNSTSQPVVLDVVQTSVASAGADMYLKEGDAGSLNGSGGSIYSWSPATYLNNASISNPNFTATQTITYTLTVSNTSGATTCSTTDDVTVFVVKPVVVPNVITVNGDGANDDWEIENIEGYPNVIIEIYNRWGNLVWKSEGYPKNWDGTNFRNGQVLPDGTYFYIINLQSQVYPEPLTGWVQIVK